MDGKLKKEGGDMKARNEKIERRVKCKCCGAVSFEKYTCSDCAHSFCNPFDQQYCKKGRTATRICKEFKKRKGAE